MGWGLGVEETVQDEFITLLEAMGGGSVNL